MNDRFRRQTAFAPIGRAGQERLARAKVVVCGVGALGSTIVERLCRAGVGSIRIVDRDWVELDNLPRQALYTLDDALAGTPKAIAAAQHLFQIDPDIQVEPVIRDLTHHNADELLAGFDCIVDGTDNFETRFLINDFSISRNVPWVHAGIVGASGQLMTIIPGSTACFRCLIADLPPVEQMQTCDSAGVIGPAVGIIANWQSLEVMRILVGAKIAPDASMRVFDLWHNETRTLNLERSPECVCCNDRNFEFLAGRVASDAKVMCGKNSVQIQSTHKREFDLSKLADRLRNQGDLLETPFLLRFSVPPYTISVFADGRGIVAGTENPDEARKIYARWIGS